LKQILDIELNVVQQRIFNASPERSFVFSASDSAKGFLLREGTDLKYGARHLKRAIERLLVQPMSNLIATDQVRCGDLIRVDYSPDEQCMTFVKEGEGISTQTMAEMADQSTATPRSVAAHRAVLEIGRPAGARSSKRSQ
jgi:ATP-dependent Clp protease ATP-binding subunit ClpB